MSWNAPKGGDGGDFVPREQCPVGKDGEHVAVLIALVDLGHQEVPDHDDPTRQRKVWRYQVAGLFEVQGPTDSKGEPFYFVERFTFSVHDKSKLRGLMRMSNIPDAQDDIETLLGQPFRLKVEEATSAKGDTTYTRTQLRKDGILDCPAILRPHVKAPVRPPFVWKLGDESLQPYDWLPRLYGKTLHDVTQASWEVSHPGEPVPVAPKPAPKPQAQAGQQRATPAPATTPAPAPQQPPATPPPAPPPQRDTPAPAAAGKPPIGRSPGRAPQPAAQVSGYTPDPRRNDDPF